MQPVNATRSLLSIVCALVCAVILSSCQPSASPTNITNSNNTGGTHKLACVHNNAYEFWVIARKGSEKAVKEIPGIRVDYRNPADGTAEDQQRIIDDLLAK